MDNILGPNWRTTLSGFIANIFSFLMFFILALAQNPPEYDNLWTPKTRQGQLIAIFSFIAFIVKSYRDWNTKDKQVTGGRIVVNRWGEQVADKVAGLQEGRIP